MVVDTLAPEFILASGLVGPLPKIPPPFEFFRKRKFLQMWLRLCSRLALDRTPKVGKFFTSSRTTENTPLILFLLFLNTKKFKF